MRGLGDYIDIPFHQSKMQFCLFILLFAVSSLCVETDNFSDLNELFTEKHSFPNTDMGIEHADFFPRFMQDLPERLRRKHEEEIPHKGLGEEVLSRIAENAARKAIERLRGDGAKDFRFRQTQNGENNFFSFIETQSEKTLKTKAFNGYYVPNPMEHPPPPPLPDIPPPAPTPPKRAFEFFNSLSEGNKGSSFIEESTASPLKSNKNPEQHPYHDWFEQRFRSSTPEQ